MKYIIVSIVLLFASCDIPELKKLKPETQKEIDSIISELGIENFDYEIKNQVIDGIHQSYFKVRLSDIDDTTNIEPYNLRIIQAYNKSDYNLDQYDFVVFYYYNKYASGDLYRMYRVRAKDGEIIEESSE